MVLVWLKVVGRVRGAYGPRWRYFHDISYLKRSRVGRGSVGGASRVGICTKIVSQQGKLVSRHEGSD